MKSPLFAAACTVALLAAAPAALAQQNNAQTNAPNTTENAAASGADHNGAVNTDSAQQPAPAHGANSFTKLQAAHRIAKHGFTNVKDLTKDANGVWHGTASHDGTPAKVWLDYKGDVGTD